MWKKLKFALIVAALLLVAPWMIPFASGDDTWDAEISVEAAAAEYQPYMHVYRGFIGSVEPGDLFTIDASDVPYDFTANLYLTNAAEMIHCYGISFFMRLSTTLMNTGNGSPPNCWMVRTSPGHISRSKTALCPSTCPGTWNMW
ncbi:MAG: hypothetical protein MUO19_00685 [Dehalococcoidales bacterium]|nr:hypothetical protein [Dehalococcoidales bacterium]